MPAPQPTHIARLREILADLRPLPNETVEQLCIRGLAVQREYLAGVAGEPLAFLKWPLLLEDQRRAWIEWAIHKLAADIEYNSWLRMLERNMRVPPEFANNVWDEKRYRK